MKDRTTRFAANRVVRISHDRKWPLPANQIGVKFTA